MLAISLISGILGGLVTAAYAVLNGASWGAAVLAYSGGGMMAMLATLTLGIGLTWAKRIHRTRTVHITSQNTASELF